MANAKKCDRCGSYYDLNCFGKYGISHGIDELRIDGFNVERIKRFELCPACGRYLHDVLTRSKDLPVKYGGGGENG